MRKRQYKKMKRGKVCPKCRINRGGGVWRTYRLKTGRWITEMTECWECGWKEESTE